MSTIWSVQTILGNVDGASETGMSDSALFHTQDEALVEYGKRYKAGLPAIATSANIYLWRSDPRPQGRSHSLVKHVHFWKDAGGTHSNEFSGAVQV